LRRYVTDTLEQICDTDGSHFPDAVERNNFIINYYERLYDIPVPAPVRGEVPVPAPNDQPPLDPPPAAPAPLPVPVPLLGDMPPGAPYPEAPGMRVADFLGREVYESAQVQNAKLNEAERIDLEQEINIQELDESLAQCKNSSALGEDGISYKF